MFEHKTPLDYTYMKKASPWVDTKKKLQTVDIRDSITGRGINSASRSTTSVIDTVRSDTMEDTEVFTKSSPAIRRSISEPNSLYPLPKDLKEPSIIPPCPPKPPHQRNIKRKLNYDRHRPDTRTSDSGIEQKQNKYLGIPRQKYSPVLHPREEHIYDEIEAPYTIQSAIDVPSFSTPSLLSNPMGSSISLQTPVCQRTPASSYVRHLTDSPDFIRRSSISTGQLRRKKTSVRGHFKPKAWMNDAVKSEVNCANAPIPAVRKSLLQIPSTNQVNPCDNSYLGTSQLLEDKPERGYRTEVNLFSVNKPPAGHTPRKVFGKLLSKIKGTPSKLKRTPKKIKLSTMSLTDDEDQFLV